ncbi:hypothetical protein ACYCCF_10780 [Streptomyces argenteolus]|uniref:hypothetical protein n=1 Tax=Streptomyces sp. NPDC025273 TaxID=3155251 RepID=UPI003388FACF
MPRPTAAQFSYGSVTVIVSTLAMLLLSRTDSGVGVAVVCAAGLALGLLVALTVPLPRGGRTAERATAPAAVRTRRPVKDIELTTAHEERVSRHSLRR